MAAYNIATRPTLDEVAAYWMKHEDECGLAFDWSDGTKLCWRCGYQSQLQLCHIVPESRDGPLEPSNLVLLCDRCHRDAPNTTDSRMMWIWLRSTSVPLCESFLIARGIEEFVRMFGRIPFVHLPRELLVSNQFVEILDEEINETIVHNGEGRRNPATLACIYARTEERLSGTNLVGVTSGDTSMLVSILAMHPAFRGIFAHLPNT